MEIKKAQVSDLGSIMPIIRDAQQFLKEQGIDQWQDGFPDEETIKNDILNAESYLFLEEGIPEGFVVLSFQPEENYRTLYGGSWLTDSTCYATIHRTAVGRAARGKGISRELFGLCERLALERGMASIRIDTHEDNRLMRHLAVKYGYTLCGIIRLTRGNAPRVVYEKILR